MFVFRFLTTELVEKVCGWPELKRWERKEIGQTLRRMGFSYREIAALIPVSKGTLSGWCRDIPLREERRGELLGKRGRRREIGQRLRQRALDRAAGIQEAARTAAIDLVRDAFWVAGVVAYWAEGSKGKELSFANSDPRLIRLFIEWAEQFFGVPRSAMTIKLHLHSGQDEKERRDYWSHVTGIPVENFGKTFIKPEGTGHRKNHLYNGTVQIRVPRSGDMLHQVRGWIEAVAELLPVMS